MRRSGKAAVVAGAAFAMLAGPSLADANAGGVVTKCLTGDTSLCLVYSYDFRPEDKYGYLSVQSKGTEVARIQCIQHRMTDELLITAGGTPAFTLDSYAISVAGISTYQAPGLPLWPLVGPATAACNGFAPIMNALP